MKKSRLFIWALTSLGFTSSAWTDCHYIDCDCNHLEGGIHSPEQAEHCINVENEIRRECNNGTSSVQKLACDPLVSGSRAWPNGTAPHPSPLQRTEKILSDFCEELQESSERPRVPYWRAIYKLIPLSPEVPTFSSLIQTAALRIQSAETLDAIQRADFLIDPTSPVNGINAHWSAAEILRALYSVHDSTAIHPRLHLRLLHALDPFQLDDIRVNIGNDIETHSFLNWMIELKNNTPSVDELNQWFLAQKAKHQSTVVGSLPPEWNSTVKIPLMNLIQSLETWGDLLFQESTNLVQILGLALPDRKIDGSKYGQTTQRLRALSNYTPWTTNETLTFLNGWAKQDSIYKQTIAALIDDPEIQTGGIPAYCQKVCDEKRPTQGIP